MSNWDFCLTKYPRVGVTCSIYMGKERIRVRDVQALFLKGGTALCGRENTFFKRYN